MTPDKFAAVSWEGALDFVAERLQNRAFGVDRGLPFPVSDIADTQTLLL
jgi:predicted molibdopterin-dependent oxidoreductase YjgC